MLNISKDCYIITVYKYKESDYGGEKMAKETVEAVRQAEQKAVALEKEAALKKEEILQKAAEDGKALIFAKTKEAKERASLELKNAEESGKKLLEEAVNSASHQVEMLLEIVTDKKQTAIAEILKEVI